MNHKSVIVQKPWGYEYLAYENEHVALWVLHIKKGHSTSMHCHPSKTTGLVVVSGTIEMKFIADSKTLQAPAKQMIRRGLFHQTCATSDDVIVFEIETPVNKKDLVRLTDTYGRECSGYENSQYELPKTDECLWFDDAVRNEFQFCGRTIIIEPVNLKDKYPNDILIFLRGNMMKTIEDETFHVIQPGDVGFVRVVETVARHMDGFSDDCVTLVVR
jgi:mannose-6-phosphate isomerase-like protein (cupin superfamily)